jgi:hypothetical protein
MPSDGRVLGGGTRLKSSGPYGPIDTDHLDLTITSEVMLLVIPLEEPSEPFTHDFADDLDAKLTLLG